MVGVTRMESVSEGVVIGDVLCDDDDCTFHSGSGVVDECVHTNDCDVPLICVNGTCACKYGYESFAGVACSVYTVWQGSQKLECLIVTKG